jgi:D-beta-D-heptose 7-phosphate kinase/D-beta-D-heptose 1-phosphate adenosyltransferase
MSGVDMVRRFRHLRALVIGDAMLDSYLEGDAARLCSEGPVPVVRATLEERTPGGAANTATNLRSLGAEVVFIGLIGPDVAGVTLREALRERNVDDRWLIEDPAVSTLHKLRILANDQYVVRYDSGDTRSSSSDARLTALARVREELPRCDVVVISDYSYGMIGEDLLTCLRELRSHHPCPLVIDSKDLRQVASAGATVITPNHLEAFLAVDGTIHSPEAGRERVEAAGRALLGLVDTQYVAVTMAQEGVLIVGRDGTSVHLPAHPVAEANDVGAGDSFTAALALALGAGAAVEEAARIGIDAAAIAVSRRRTAAVQHQELLQRVSLADGHLHPPLAELQVHLDAARARGQRIVFTNGVFDILHAGHVHFLREAKRLGDVLVVGVNTDGSARRLKGPGRPINSERDRLALVAELDSVDHVVLFDEDDPATLIRALRPAVHVKGGDYEHSVLPEEAAVREVGGRVEILPLVGTMSTSIVIERIVAMALEATP